MGRNEREGAREKGRERMGEEMKGRKDCTNSLYSCMVLCVLLIISLKVSHCFWGLETFLRSPPQLCPLLNMANLELGGIPWYGVEVHT